MVPYYLIYIFLLLSTLFNTIHNDKFIKFIFLFFCIIIGLFGGLRFETGFDHEPYLEYYNNLPSFETNDGLPYLVGNMEIGYFFLNVILNTLYFNSQFILLLPSLFCIYAFYKLIITFKNNYTLSLLAYFSFDLVHNHFSLVRVSICVGLLYLAISMYLKNKNIFNVFFLLVISLLFHITAIFYVLIFLLSIYTKPNEKFIKFLTIFLFSFSLTKIDLAYEFSKLLFNVDLFSLITSKYLDYGNIEYTATVSFYLYVLFNIFFIFLSFKLKNEAYLSKKLQNLVIYCSLIQITFMTIFPSNYILWSRISIVTTVLQSFLFSIFIYNTSLYKRIFLVTAYILVTSVFFYYNMTSFRYGLEPYKSILNNIF
jgi:hypothetical protein